MVSRIVYLSLSIKKLIKKEEKRDNRKGATALNKIIYAAPP